MTSDVLGRARQLLASGRAGEAVRLLEDARNAGGGGPALHAMLGYAHFHNDHIADAKVALAAGLKLFPFDPVLQEAMARMRWLSGEGPGFADEFLAAVAARPGDMVLRLKCADLLRLAGDTAKAEALLREALVLAPGDLTLQAWLGVLLDETGHFDEALGMLGNAARAYPDEPALRLNLSHVLLRMGRGVEALQEISRVRRAQPGAQLAITYEVMALKQLGDTRHDRLCNYQDHVRACLIDTPSGFASLADFNRALGERLRGLQDASAHPLDQSLRGGSQTSHNLVFDNDAVVRSYFAALEAPIRAYIDALGDDPAHPLEGRKAPGHALSGCWSVLLRPGGFHVNHTHPNGWISSSYYVSLPPEMANPASQQGWIKFGEPRWPVPGCGIERVVQPQEGLVVLFPSYMWHGTIPFSSGERLTAPFDVVPKPVTRA